MNCDWASCRNVAVATRGDYYFCATHLAEDARMRNGKDPHGEPLPPDVLDPRADGHGSEARYKQHKREGDEPCRACLTAAAQAYADRRRGAKRAAS